MRKVWAQITCLHCGNKLVRAVNTYFNPQVDSDTDRKILEDEMFDMKCDQCGKKVKAIYPSIYKDTKRKMIIFIKEKEIVDEPLLRKRYVDNIESLKELILILRDGLDDQAIYSIKEILKRKNKGNDVRYLTSDEEYLFFESNGQIQGVTRAEYTKRMKVDTCEKVMNYH